MVFFEKYKVLSLNTLNEDFDYKSIYHIQALFTWFANCEVFSFVYKEVKECILCKCHNESIKFYNPLISIDNDYILCDRLEDIFYNKFSVSYSICERCSYTPDKRIKLGNLYSKYIAKICIDFKAPNIISLCFEITNISVDNNDITQFRHLYKFKDNIIKFIKERICFYLIIIIAYVEIYFRNLLIIILLWFTKLLITF